MLKINVLVVCLLLGFYNTIAADLAQAESEFLLAQYSEAATSYTEFLRENPKGNSLLVYQRACYTQSLELNYVALLEISQMGLEEFPQDTVLQNYHKFADDRLDALTQWSIQYTKGEAKYTDADYEDLAKWNTVQSKFAWDEKYQVGLQFSQTDIYALPINGNKDLWSYDFAFQFKNFHSYAGHELWITPYFAKSNMLGQGQVLGLYAGLKDATSLLNWQMNLGVSKLGPVSYYQYGGGLGYHTGWFDQGFFAGVDYYGIYSKLLSQHGIDVYTGLRKDRYFIQTTGSFGPKAFRMEADGFLFHNRSEVHKSSYEVELGFRIVDELWLSGFTKLSKYQQSQILSIGATLYWNW